MELEKRADAFSLPTRASQPADGAAFDQRLAPLSETMRACRVTLKAETPENACPALAPRGAGVYEIQTLPEAGKALDEIRRKRLAQHAGEYDCKKPTARCAAAEAMTGDLNDENAQATTAPPCSIKSKHLFKPCARHAGESLYPPA